MSVNRQKAYLRYWDDITRNAYIGLLAQANEEGPYDGIISLGDNTSGNNESGMVDEKAQSQFHSFKMILETNFPRVPTYFIWGGHDMGYFTKSSLIGGRAGGHSLESFNMAHILLGLPWQTFEMGGYTFIILASEVIKAAYVSNHHQAFFLQKTREQSEFLLETLSHIKEKVILAIHEPQQLRYLWPYIQPYKNKIVLTLAGHLHLKVLGALYRHFTSKAKTLNVRVVPSPWGIATPWRAFGRGGFCVLTMKPDSLELQYHRVNPAN